MKKLRGSLHHAKRLKRLKIKKKNRSSKLKNVRISYYDTSDSEYEPQNSALPMDQSRGYETGTKILKENTKSMKESRLSQLLKYNLFALIELGNACIILKIQKDLNMALNSLNETVTTLTALSDKIGSPIIAQDLWELLMSQILQLKTWEFEKENNYNQNYTENCTQENKKNEGIRKSNIPDQFIFASSDFEMEEQAQLTPESSYNFIEQPENK